MKTFTSILLIVIFILVISDVFFLWKIYKSIKSKKKHLPDERYFELKYNINLLKAVSAILIFLISFLGFNSYNNISENMNKDFSKNLEKQNDKIDDLTKKLSDYIYLVDSLKVEEGESIKTLGEINQQFGRINKKIKNSEETLKYTTKFYIVNDLKFPRNKIHEQVKNETLTLYFKNLTTVYNEKLPFFKFKPLIVLQGRGISLDVVEVTKDYVKVSSHEEYQYIELDKGRKFNNAYYESGDSKFYYFDMWIAEPN